MSSTTRHVEVDSLDFLKLQTQAISARFESLESYLRGSFEGLFQKMAKHDAQMDRMGKFMDALSIKSTSQTSLMQSILAQSRALKMSAATGEGLTLLAAAPDSNPDVATALRQRFPERRSEGDRVKGELGERSVEGVRGGLHIETDEERGVMSVGCKGLVAGGLSQGHLGVNLSLITPSQREPGRAQPRCMKERREAEKGRQQSLPHNRIPALVRFETPQGRKEAELRAQKKRPPKLRSRGMILGKRQKNLIRRRSRLERMRDQGRKRVQANLNQFADRLDRLQFVSQDLHTGASGSSFCDQSHFLDRLSKDDSANGLQIRPSIPVFGGSTVLSNKVFSNRNEAGSETWGEGLMGDNRTSIGGGGGLNIRYMSSGKRVESETFNMEIEKGPKLVPKVPSLHFESMQMVSEQAETPRQRIKSLKASLDEEQISKKPEQIRGLFICQDDMQNKLKINKNKKLSSKRNASFESSKTVQKNDSMAKIARSSFVNMQNKKMIDANLPNSELSIFNVNKNQAIFSSGKSFNGLRFQGGRGVSSSVREMIPEQVLPKVSIRDPGLEENSPSSISHSRLQRDLNALRFDFSYFAEGREHQNQVSKPQGQFASIQQQFPTPNAYMTPFQNSNGHGNQILKNHVSQQQLSKRNLNQIRVGNLSLIQKGLPRDLSSIRLQEHDPKSKFGHLKMINRVPEFKREALAGDSFFSEIGGEKRMRSQQEANNFLQELDFGEFGKEIPNAPTCQFQLKPKNPKENRQAQDLLNRSVRTETNREGRDNEQQEGSGRKPTLSEFSEDFDMKQSFITQKEEEGRSVNQFQPEFTIEEDSGMLKMMNRTKNFSAFSGIAFNTDPSGLGFKNDDSHFNLDFLAQLDMNDDFTGGRHQNIETREGRENQVFGDEPLFKDGCFTAGVNPTHQSPGTNCFQNQRILPGLKDQVLHGGNMLLQILTPTADKTCPAHPHSRKPHRPGIPLISPPSNTNPSKPGHNANLSNIFAADLNALKSAMDRNHYHMFDSQFEKKFQGLRQQLSELNQLGTDAKILHEELSRPGRYSGSVETQAIVDRYAGEGGVSALPDAEEVLKVVQGMGLPQVQSGLRKLISDQFGFNSFLILVKKQLGEQMVCFRGLFN